MEQNPQRPTLDELRNITFPDLDAAEAYFNEQGFSVVRGVRPWELCLPGDVRSLTCRDRRRGCIDLSGAGIALIFSGSVEAYRKIEACDPTTLRANPGGKEKRAFNDDGDLYYGGIQGGHLLH